MDREKLIKDILKKVTYTRKFSDVIDGSLRKAKFQLTGEEAEGVADYILKNTEKWANKDNEDVMVQVLGFKG